MQCKVQLTTSLQKPVSQNKGAPSGREGKTRTPVQEGCSAILEEHALVNKSFQREKVVSDFRSPRTVCPSYSRSVGQVFKLSWTSLSAKAQGIRENNKLLKIKSLHNVV